MSNEPSMPRQLIEARRRIVAQLEDIDSRATALGIPFPGYGLRDYRGPAAELREELREIDAILSAMDSRDA